MAATSSPSIAALELRGISKHFKDLQALSNVTLNLRRQTVHALLGENGAGKSTLMRIAFGMMRPDEGEIHINGVSAVFRSPANAIASRIGMVHQHFLLASSMTVTENIELGGHGRYKKSESARRILQLAKETGFEIDPFARIESLGIAAQQRLEIIKALFHGARILILDEPTAVLAPDEARALLVLIRRLVKSGCSVVLITHKLRDAMQYADDVSVLRHGKLVWSGSADETSTDSVAAAMLGRTSISTPPPDRRQDHTSISQDALIKLEDVHIPRRLSPAGLRSINLEVHTGEIVGIGALNGAATDLLRVIAGRQHPSAGRMITPSRIGFVPEDRQRDALIEDFNLVENIALRDSGNRRGRMRWLEMRHDTREIVNSFDVRVQTLDTPVRALSGGNQQKLILGRELGDSPIALIAENPTWGLDFRATVNVHDRIRTAASRGCAVVFYSSDIDEIVALADRVFVVRGTALVSVARNAEVIGRTLIGSDMLEH